MEVPILHLYCPGILRIAQELHSTHTAMLDAFFPRILSLLHRQKTNNQAFWIFRKKKTQGQKSSSQKKLKKFFQKTQANKSKTQYKLESIFSFQKKLIFDRFGRKFIQTEIFRLSQA